MSFPFWQASPDELRTVLSSIAEGLFVVDLQGNLLFMNPAAQRLLGLRGVLEGVSGREGLKQYFAAFSVTTLDGRSLPPEERPFARLLRGESFEDFECKVRHPK